MGTLLSIVGSIPVILWLSIKYFTSLIGVEKKSLLYSCRGYLRGSMLVCAVWFIGIIFSVIGKSDIVKIINNIILSWSFIISGEILISIVLEWHRPDKDGSSRLIYNSRILSLLDAENSVKEVLREGLEYQFGFDVSGTWFLRRMGSLFPLLVSMVVFLMVGLSALFSVDPGERRAPGNSFRRICFRCKIYRYLSR